jgi:hypothetical protein
MAIISPRGFPAAARNSKGGKQEIQGALHLLNLSPTDSLNEWKGKDESKSENQGQGSGKPKPTCQRDGMSVTAPPPPFSAGGAGQEKKPPGPPCGGCYLILGSCIKSSFGQPAGYR